MVLSRSAWEHQVVIEEALLAVLALVLVVATWRGSPRAALPLLCLSPLVLVRTLAALPVLLCCAGPAEWVAAGVQAGVVGLAVHLVLPAARRQSVESRAQ
jgi:hypothetical protein